MGRINWVTLAMACLLILLVLSLGPETFLTRNRGLPTAGPSQKDDLRSHLRQQTPSVLQEQCRLSSLNRRLGLTHHDPASGRKVCRTALPGMHTRFIGPAPWEMSLEFDWRPEFNECSLGMLVAAVGIGVTDVYGAIKSVLYHRSTPITFYFIYGIDWDAESIATFFKKYAFPYVRIVFCHVSRIMTVLTHEDLDMFMGTSKETQRLRGGPTSAIHHAYGISGALAYLWALPGETFLLDLQRDLYYTMDPLEAARSLYDAAPDKWYAVGRDAVFELDTPLPPLYNGHVKGANNSSCTGAHAINVHQIRLALRDGTFLPLFKRTLETIGSPGGVSHMVDFDFFTVLNGLSNKVHVDGCYSFSDTGLHFYQAKKTDYRKDGWSMFCDSIPHVFHHKLGYVVLGPQHPHVPQSIRFASLMVLAMEQVPWSFLRDLCPFPVSQAGPEWYWHHDPGETSETLPYIQTVRLASHGKNEEAACAACLGPQYKTSKE
jgi:hypothetical protein